MGMMDRDYFRQGGRGSGGYGGGIGGTFLASLTPAVKWILFINAGLFVLEFFGRRLGVEFFCDRQMTDPATMRAYIDFSLYHKIFAIYEPWLRKYFLFSQYLTYQFLHGGFTHLFFNMFGVYMFGRYIERQIGTMPFLKLYLMGGVFAGICHLVFLGAGVQSVPMIGASGSLCAVLATFGLLNPNTELMIFLGFIPVKMRASNMVLLYAGLTLLMALNGGGNVAHLAHLGGMLFGFLYVRNIFGLGRIIGNDGPPLPRAGSFFGHARRQARVYRGREYEEAEYTEGRPASGRESRCSSCGGERDYRLEEILEKLRTRGMHTLTDEDWSYIQKKRRQ